MRINESSTWQDFPIRFSVQPRSASVVLGPLGILKLRAQSAFKPCLRGRHTEKGPHLRIGNQPHELALIIARTGRMTVNTTNIAAFNIFKVEA